MLSFLILLEFFRLHHLAALFFHAAALILISVPPSENTFFTKRLIYGTLHDLGYLLWLKFAFAFLLLFCNPRDLQSEVAHST